MIKSAGKTAASSRESIQAISSASLWLLRSGIQNVSADKKLRGGVAAWYEPDKKIYPFLYSEITGYALSAWMFLHRIHPDAKFVRHARLAAGWLMRNALLKEGGVKTRLYLVNHYVSPNYCFYFGRVYSFDAAMVGYGLLQFFKTSKDPHCLQSVQKILEFLVTVMKRKDGTYEAYYDSQKKRCSEDFDKWSDQGGSFHAKLALLFIDYYEVTNDENYKKLAGQLLDTVMKTQEKDGRFVTSRKDRSTHLHPHAYTLEGLLYGAVKLNRRRYLEAAAKGFQWMLRGVSNDGSVSSIYEKGSFSHHERSDIVGQTLRIGSILYALDSQRIKKYLPTLRGIRGHLSLFQQPAGGFVYGFATDGLMRNHWNAWSTMFGIQALWMHDEFVVCKRPLNINHFI